MVNKQPIPAEQLLVKWTEFVAEFKTLENLVPASTKLNNIQVKYSLLRKKNGTFQYFSLDIIGAAALSLLVAASLVIWILKLLIGRIRTLFRLKNKKE